MADLQPYRLKQCKSCWGVMHVPRHLFYQVDLCAECVERKRKERERREG